MLTQLLTARVVILLFDLVYVRVLQFDAHEQHGVCVTYNLHVIFSSWAPLSMSTFSDFCI